MLKEFFPLATIYAIDINPASINLNLGDNVIKYLCSQDNFEYLKILFNDVKFDIIIKDGSHMISHQQTSLGFFFLFKKQRYVYL
jgi:hypothetical protein